MAPRLNPTLLATLTLSLALVAHAQTTEIDAERFKPAVTHDGWVTAEGSSVRSSADPLELGAFLNYGYRPLVVVDGDGEVLGKLVSGHMGLDLLGSYTIGGPFALGLALPLYGLQSGDGDPSSAGLGDLRLVPKLRLLDDRYGLGLALALEVRAPTHTGDYNGGARNGQLLPKAIIDHRFLSGVRVGANVGVAIREKTTLLNVEAGNELLYAAAIGYRFGGERGDTELGLELAGAAGLSAQDREELPLEGFVFLRHAPSEAWEVIGGPGVGVIPGYGIPTFRVFAGVRYHPTAHDRDRDGIPDDEDRCPDVPEDFDHEEDSDGCPEEDKDSDRDGVPDKSDECPTAKETINGHEDEDGCPDTGDPRVIYEDGKFKILDAVHFEHGKAEIKEESHSLLDQVALMIKANPEVKKVRVEGHTDDTGPKHVNRRLSQARAEAVRRYLGGKGVSPSRLTAKGYGPDKPLEKGTSDAVRAKNRRVEFVVDQ
jgi:outer membrane protein OmpA-like peptidoglycan-associated protein